MEKGTLWQLRYRSPLSPTKSVDDVIILTDTDNPDDAKALADWWLATKVPSPSTRFVYVRRLVVATSAEMRKAQGAKASAEPESADERGPNPAQAASRDDSVPKPAPGDDDEMSGTGARGRGPRSTGTTGRVGV